MIANSYAALWGTLGVAVVSAQLLHGTASLASQRPRAHRRAKSEEGTPGSTPTAPGSGVTAALSSLETLEPPPLGDQVVLWALPRKPQLAVKVRLSTSRRAAALGEARGVTAIQVMPTSLPVRQSDCREWLAAVPAGYVCRQEVQLQAGYASAPPAQESALGWQRYRYGVVTAKQVGLLGAPGSYLRDKLHQGDGVTVVREVNGQAQLIGHTWLARKDVELATPSTMAPLALESLPPGARPAWVVPTAGDSLAPLYPPTGPAAPPLGMLPRYSVVLVSDAPAAPGRMLVQLTEEARATLKAYPEAQAAPAVELDAAVLRRFIPIAPPPEVGPEERWVDISLAEQVATAYVGKTPIFTTLVSTGKGHLTPPGSFFVYRKYLTQTMANQRGAAAQYDFRQVPHAQFFNGRIGLHAVLWHDSLGEPVSHGCVNLSPAAAAQFFAFSSPALPTGWHSVLGGPPVQPAPSAPSDPASSAAPTGPTPDRAPPPDLAARPAPLVRSAPARLPPVLAGTRVIVRR